MAMIFALTLCSVLVGVADANAFLKHDSNMHAEWMGDEDVRTSIIADINDMLGSNATRSRLAGLVKSLRPMYAALPKNGNGRLDHATVRYALHRLFVQRHGWFIRGLEPAGEAWNSSSPASILQDRVPAYIQELFEERLGDKGFSVFEVATLAATLEHLVHGEVVARLVAAYKGNELSLSATLDSGRADEVIDTYMMSYILGSNLSEMLPEEIKEQRGEVAEIYPGWGDTEEFLRDMRHTIAYQEKDRTNPFVTPKLNFDAMLSILEMAGQKFGPVQDSECRQVKDLLLEREEEGTGRVRLVNFYKSGADGQWQFHETIEYLRSLGALDETDPGDLRVIVPNYVSSQSNCIASSNFYSVCCIDECEGLLSHLEGEIVAPEAAPGRIAAIVENLASSTVQAPRNLSTTLHDRLERVAEVNGGMVPLHSRLFAQWMHHAFPRECPYPHLSGTTSPQTANEWLDMHGRDTVTTQEEMERFVKENEHVEAVEQELLWTLEEELLVARPTTTGLHAFLRNAMLFATLASIAIGLSQTAKSGQKSWCIDDISAEKTMV